jgi:hypothetical protein
MMSGGEADEELEGEADPSIMLVINAAAELELFVVVAVGGCIYYFLLLDS